MSKMWKGLFARLDRVSRSRALTEAESALLERSILALDRPETRRRSIEVLEIQRGPSGWTDDQQDRFFDLVAEGTAIRAAARMVGKSESAGIGLFDRFRRSLGAQGQ